MGVPVHAAAGAFKHGHVQAGARMYACSHVFGGRARKSVREREPEREKEREREGEGNKREGGKRQHCVC